MKIEGPGSESGSISRRHGSAEPDPHQNVMDPQHWYTAWNLFSWVRKSLFYIYFTLRPCRRPMNEVIERVVCAVRSPSLLVQCSRYSNTEYLQRVPVSFDLKFLRKLWKKTSTFEWKPPWIDTIKLVFFTGLPLALKPWFETFRSWVIHNTDQTS